MCKWRESLSKRVLIGRGLDQNKKICYTFGVKFLCSCEGTYARHCLRFPVVMAGRPHLFPFRTQKLSSHAPTILGWQRPGKIGHCRILLYSSIAQLAEHAAVNRGVVGSSPTGGAIKAEDILRLFLYANLIYKISWYVYTNGLKLKIFVFEGTCDEQ